MTGDVAAPCVIVRIPAQIRQLYGTLAREEVHAESVAGAVQALDERYPGMGQRLAEPDGRARRWVNFFVDQQDIRELEGMATPLREGSELVIVPSIAGG